MKIALDAIFGWEHFRNELVWQYSTFHASKRAYKKNYDLILFYSKGNEYHFNWEAITEPYRPLTIARYDKEDEGGRYKIIKGAKSYMGKGTPPNAAFFMPQLQLNAREHLGYPTQKPLKLLDRIIQASSNPGDMILDPFAGCATACISAERLGRQWVGIDISSLAAKLVKVRLEKEMGLFYDINHRVDIPRRTDLGELPNYRTHKHTLYGKQEGICTGCLVMFPFRNMTIDHIVPQSKGGSDHFDNLQLLCNACNSMKGTKSQEQFIAKLKASGLRD